MSKTGDISPLPESADGLPHWAEALKGHPGLLAEPGGPLARRSTLKVGGAAELLVRVKSQDALSAVLRCATAAGVPFEVLGLGSNILIPDEGLRGIVCRLEGDFLDFEIEDARLTAGAGVALPKLARATAGQGLLGLEALSGFPSTVGGAVCMNAGCYGTEIKDVLIDVTCVERDGNVRLFTCADIEPAYRSTRLQKMDLVVTSARFELSAGDAEAALGRIDELNKKRWQALPSGRPTAGSVFKNPDGDHAGRLIEECGLRGQHRGGASISVEHANVITNEGGATAEDVLWLMCEAYEQVRDRFGVELVPELVLMGPLAQQWLVKTKGA